MCYSSFRIHYTRHDVCCGVRTRSSVVKVACLTQSIYILRARLYLLRDRRLGSDGSGARSVCSGVRGGLHSRSCCSISWRCDYLMVIRCWVRLMADIAGSSKSTWAVSDTFTSLLWACVWVVECLQTIFLLSQCYIWCSAVWVVTVCLQT